jgi:hypothetical protein
MDSLFLKIKDKCRMLPLEKQQSERKLFHHSALPGGGGVPSTGRKNEEEDVSSYWITLRKREDIGI